MRLVLFPLMLVAFNIFPQESKVFKVDDNFRKYLKGVPAGKRSLGVNLDLVSAIAFGMPNLGIQKSVRQNWMVELYYGKSAVRKPIYPLNNYHYLPNSQDDGHVNFGKLNQLIGCNITLKTGRMGITYNTGIGISYQYREYANYITKQINFWPQTISTLFYSTSHSYLFFISSQRPIIRSFQICWLAGLGNEYVFGYNINPNNSAAKRNTAKYLQTILQAKFQYLIK